MSRAVYVPPAKRKKQQRENQRFHGAFTGGFSAGYFNTVGSKEGWKPSEDVDRQQQVADFMDDQDHQDFGGPSQLRQEYNGADTAKDETKGVKGSSSSSTANPTGIELNRIFEVSYQQGVGLRLLRSMGWRSEASSAFVVVDPDITNASSGNTELSKRKIRKIQLQQSRMEKIPPPKFDVAGLGFEALKDAPEFRRHREYRQKMAQSRAHGTANVYRTSSVLQPPSNKNSGNLGNDDDDDNMDENYMAHNTMEDFVGSKSVGGFALREDDDDAYDEDGGQGDRQGPWGGGGQQKQQLNISNDKYNTEIYEPESSDDEFHVGNLNNSASKNAMAKKAAATADVFGGALSAWADIDSKTTDGKQESNGRGVMTGFRLGGIVNMAKVRYPGPDVPIDYDIKAHVFAETVHPHVFQAIGRAVQLQHRERQKEASHHEALNTAKARARSIKEDRTSVDKRTKSTTTTTNTTGDTKRLQAPMAGQKFAGLAMTMKNRFTSGDSIAATNNNETAAPIGLHFPSTAASFSKITNGDNSSAVQPGDPQNLQIIRTVQTFVPSMLVCKRFHVPAPLVSRQQQAVSTSALKKTKEELFFEQEILPAGGDVKKAESEQEPDQPSGIVRPSMEILKSIFQEDEEASSSDESDDGENTQLVVRDPNIASSTNNGKSAELKNEPSEDKIVPFDKDKERKRKRKDRHRQKHKKRSSSRKHADSDDEDDDDDKNKKRKKKRKHKSKKKKSKKKKEKDDDESSSSSDSS